MGPQVACCGLIIAAIWLAAPVLPAATKESAPPDKEMLQMMELLKEIELIRRLEMMQDVGNLEDAGGPLKSGMRQKAPPKTKETAK